MVKAHAYFKIIRPANAFMTAATVFLGWWLSKSALPLHQLILLMYAAVASLSYGNVINDIADLDTDRINKPGRPLPSGMISVKQAATYSFILASTALAAGFTVSPLFGLATAVPVFLLSLYAWKLKATPLIGNLLVSLLVAYALIYGGLTSDQFSLLWGPASLAFLINMCREIIKDLQDIKGDKTSGIHTTALLSPRMINLMIVVISVLYLFAIWIPFFSGFGPIYLALVFVTTIPLHAWWLRLFFSDKRERNFSTISASIKVELLAGLFSLSIDRLLLPFIL